MAAYQSNLLSFRRLKTERENSDAVGHLDEGGEEIHKVCPYAACWRTD